MSVISPIACLMGRHEPLRRNVEWDGLHYVGNCRHCGKEIVRLSHRNWREKLSEAG